MPKQSPVADTVEAWFMRALKEHDRLALFSELMMPPPLTTTAQRQHFQQVLKWLNEPVPQQVAAPVLVTAGRVDRGTDANMQPVRDAEDAYQRGKVTDYQLDTLLSYYKQALVMTRTMPELFGSAIAHDLQMRLLRTEDMIARRQA